MMWKGVRQQTKGEGVNEKEWVGAFTLTRSVSYSLWCRNTGVLCQQALLCSGLPVETRVLCQQAPFRPPCGNTGVLCQQASL